MKTKNDVDGRKHVRFQFFPEKMVHTYHLAKNYGVYNMNNPVQYEPVGHLAAPFTTNAATRGETFQNGDLFLWNLISSAPYTADIFNPSSTNSITFSWPKLIKMVVC